MKANFLTALALLPLLTAFASGCGSETTESTNSDQQALSDPFANDKTAFAFFLSKGLKNYQVAGIIGNLDQESGDNPGAVEPGGPGRGIAQWSAGARWDDGSADSLTWYANDHGLSPSSLSTQLEFVWYELETFPGYGLADLRNATNVTDATIRFEQDFERCGTCAESQRIAYAEAALASYGSTSPPKSGPPTPIPPAPSGCDVIKSGQGLVAGHSFFSCNHQFYLAMQGDGNLVLYQNGLPLWASHTVGQGYVAVMEGDGNFVVYGRHSDPAWASGTQGHSGAGLSVQNDGNMVIYATSGPIWQTNTR